MKKYVTLVALLALFGLISCGGAKKVRFSELEKICGDVNSKSKDPGYAEGPDLALEGYLVLTTGQGVNDKGSIEISEERNTNSPTVSILINKGAGPNQLEEIKNGDKVSFRLHTDGDEIAAEGDKVSVMVSSYGIPALRECAYQMMKIRKA